MPALAELGWCGIETSEDVGEIVYALIEQQVLKTAEGDSKEDFNGLFTLDNLFDVDL
jgi:uncharacterized repeat protein (TIGR04138 family)